jgi:probable rRNA maturation factor
MPPKGPCGIGDVVICTDVAARQARERGGSIRGEVTLLLIHGLLHLLGYDHKTHAQKKRMFALQDTLLERERVAWRP